jgi:hypothetical protein
MIIGAQANKATGVINSRSSKTVKKANKGMIISFIIIEQIEITLKFGNPYVSIMIKLPQLINYETGHMPRTPVQRYTRAILDWRTRSQHIDSTLDRVEFEIEVTTKQPSRAIREVFVSASKGSGSRSSKIGAIEMIHN